MAGRTLSSLLLAGTALALGAAAPASAQLLGLLGGRTTEAQRPLTPFYGNISPFYGNISPFYGNISPFYGNISPFYGNISPFWGNISPFWGNISPFYGNISPFWGNISPFGATVPAGATVEKWNSIGGFWTDLGGRWGAIASSWAGVSGTPNPEQLQGYAAGLRDIVDRSAAFWGPAVQARTGQDFAAGFADPLLARYGIRLDDPASLAGLSAARRSQFFLEWYDRLMDLSGSDRVDHWMRTVRWTPALSQSQGAGSDSVIGLLDFTVKDPTLAKSVQRFTGVSDVSNGHGSAVAGLMVAPQDGRGVMGIAPRATVIGYNPFDETGTASWADVTKGVQALASSKASIINMSLGVPGWTLNPEWNGVFTNLKNILAVQNNVFVIAAGNDGLAQTKNVEWALTNPAIVVVGSIDPNEQISGFSNRPGSACLTTLGLCRTPLMNRFIVAPGELILVADDQGGTTRMTGTSFAAPLVSATIALLHDRWPWLVKYPQQTTDVVLKSARDLGAPGVDPVYGVGVLDVEAAQSPLSFDAVKWYEVDKKGELDEVSVGKLKSDSKTIARWEADSAFFYVYEQLGATFRDFTVPLSSKLIGKTAQSAAGKQEQFQQYLYSRFLGWAGAGTGGTSGERGFFGFGGATSGVANPYGVDLQMRIAPRTRTVGFRQSPLPYQTAFRLTAPDGRLGLTMGAGDGAVELGGARGFGMASDYDGDMGGVNPVLGMASGGAFAQASYGFGDRLRVAVGMTQRTLRRDLNDTGIVEQFRLGGVRDNAAGAAHVSASYRLSGALSVSADYTRLDERAALLGVQSVDRRDLAGGAVTDGVTLGADLALSDTLSLAASGTAARTRAGGAQTLATTGGGLRTSAFQLALTKSGLVQASDRMRLTLSQPMYLERGQIAFTGVEVVDRREGTLGAVTRTIDVTGGQRPFVAEALYARPLIDGAAELGLFGRARLRAGTAVDQLPAYMGGLQFRLAM